MNKQPQSFYEGTASNKIAVPQPHLLLEFQEKRREYLDKNTKQRRDDVLSRNRQLLIEAKSGFTRQAENDFEEDKDAEDMTERESIMNEKIADVEDHLNRKFERMEFERPDPEDTAEIAQRKKKSNKLSDRTRLAFLSKQLTIPEWMIAPPSNLNGDYWFVYSKPEGPRCFVISTESQTFRRNKNGIIEETFLSKLPGGSPSEEECTGKTCILDCIFNKQLNIYYIMDVIVWNDVSMSVNSTESRFFFIQSNILTNKELTEVSEDNEYIFATPSKHNCTVEGFTTVYQENTRYVKEGLLFAHKEAEYIAGSNPYLLAWKDMFTSLYPIETDSRGLPTDDVQCVLELNENNELQTLDNIVLAVVSEDDVPGNRFKGGNLYRVSIESMGINQAEPDIFKAFTFYGVKILNKSSYKRAKADNISKIIFQYLIRNVPITAEHIRTAIQRADAQEDLKILE